MRARLFSLPIFLLRRGFTTFSRNYANKKLERCDAHMNELPVPCGPWDAYYKNRQKFYTQCLVAGGLWWLFSLIMLIWTGSLFLNWGPPVTPGPPAADMVEECEDD